jgi:guanyl-specific ribonuclease Sa
MDIWKQLRKYLAEKRYIVKKYLNKLITLVVALVILMVGSMFGLFQPGDEESSGQESSIQAEVSSKAEISKAESSKQESSKEESSREESSQKETSIEESSLETSEEEPFLDADGEYTSVEDVALYLYLYGELPSNFITKKEAQDLGWVSSEGNLWEVTDHMSIGGDKFGNYEGLLPEASGRQYYECDVNYEGGYRGDERIVYSNDGLIYYTDDHYKTFTLLYGEE